MGVLKSALANVTNVSTDKITIGKLPGTPASTTPTAVSTTPTTTPKANRSGRRLRSLSAVNKQISFQVQIMTTADKSADIEKIVKDPTFKTKLVDAIVSFSSTLGNLFGQKVEVKHLSSPAVSEYTPATTTSDSSGASRVVTLSGVSLLMILGLWQ